MVVDDESQFVEMVHARLSEEGYTVKSALNGPDGLAMIRSEKPDLVISDVLLPGMTGYELVKKIKDNVELSDIPIIIISARDSMKDFFNSWDIYKFFPKPFKWEEVLNSIANVLGEVRIGPKSPSSTNAPAESPALQTGASKKAILIGVEDFIVGKVKDFLKTKNFSVEMVLDEKELIELATKNVPDFVFVQYWDDKTKFDAIDVYKKLHASPATQKINFVAYCSNMVSVDAIKAFGTKQVVAYKDSAQLTQRLGEFLQVAGSPALH